MTTYYCLIKEGVVANRTVFDGAMPNDWSAVGDEWVASDDAQIGWAYDGKIFTPPPAPKTEPPVKPEPDHRTVLLDKMLDEYAAKVAGDAAAPVDLKAAAVARVKDMVTP